MAQGVPNQNILDLRGRRAQKRSNPVVTREVSESRLHDEKTREKKVEANFVKKFGIKNRFLIFNKLRRYPSLVIFGSSLVILAVGFFCVTTINSAKDAQGRVLGASTQAFTYLQTAELALRENNREAVRDSLENASKEFETASSLLSDIKSKYGIAIRLSGLGSELDTGDHILQAGTSLTQAGIRIDDFVTQIQESDQQGYIAFFSAYQKEGQEIKEALASAHRNLMQVEIESVPENYHEQFTELRSRFFSLYGSISQADSMLTVFSDIFGFTGEKTFLLVFQNNQELRPTGGFIGSIARVSFMNGKVTSLEVPEGGSYDISGQQTLEVKAPQPLRLVNPQFSFQDANWFPDFPTSAKKILAMYYSAGNAEVDGMLAFTPDVMIKFLELSGPVEVSGRSGAVSSENFIDVLREDIEQRKVDDPTKPKKIIAELMPKLLEKVFDLPPDQQINLAVILDESIRTKDIQVFSQNEEFQRRLKKHAGLAGLFEPNATGQFVKLVGANIAGGKTDRSISQHIELITKEENGNIINTLTITKRHDGIASDPFSGVVHLSYLRVYVPFGSEFLSANGFYQVPENLFQNPNPGLQDDPDIAIVEQRSTVDPASLTSVSQEFGMTVFGNWVRVEPGKTVKATISYKLPSGLKKPWELHVAKQPGSSLTGFTWNFTRKNIVEDLQATHPAHIETSRKEGIISFDLDEDVDISVIPN